MHPRAAELIAKLELEPHPEGGFYRRIFQSKDTVTPSDDRGPRHALTATYFLLTAETISRWHQVDSDEVWHLSEGGPLELFEIDPSMRSLERYRLGSMTGEGSRIHIVAAGSWQAARSLGDYALMCCTVGPGFDFSDFRLLGDDEGAVAKVREQWPELGFLV